MTDTLSLPTPRAQDSTRTAYFAALTAARPIGSFIARELDFLTSQGAKALRQCGRYPIGSGEIELFQRENGRLYARGVKWCASRYCPTCQPRIMAALGWTRGVRARTAKDNGYSVGFLSLDVPDCEPGELAASLDLLLMTFRKLYPSPSRMPKAWKKAGLVDFIGADWNVELDWNAETGQWHPHIHAVIFRQSGAWTQEALAFLTSLWPWAALVDAQEAHSPEAVARYTVKAENAKPYLWSLFNLAHHGMTAQVGEYLHAVQGLRLRSASPKLSKLLHLRDDPQDAELLTEMDASRHGNSLQRLTLGEWCQSWG